MWTRAVLAALAGLACAGEAAAVKTPAKSLYTNIDLAQCTRLKHHPDGSTWRCAGLPGYPILVAQGDLRFYLSFGLNAEKRRAAEQTLSAFNTPFADRRTRATVEWRFETRDDKPVPYAAIVRYFTSLDAAKGEVLVVSRVTATEACHVAYIDALATPEAIVLARRIADERARSFDCRQEPQGEGQGQHRRSGDGRALDRHGSYPVWLRTPGRT
jgi:hypothetical protein